MSDNTQNGDESAGSIPAASTKNPALPSEKAGACPRCGADKGADLGELPAPFSGGVYAIMGVPGWVKIGKAKNIAARISELQVGHPVRLRLIAVLAPNPEFESFVHMRFEHLRGCGEWFRLDEDLVRALRGEVDLVAEQRERWRAEEREAEKRARRRWIAETRERGEARREGRPKRPRAARGFGMPPCSAAPTRDDIRAWLAARRSA